LEKINEEEKLIRNWKIYLEMVGKNGISKMVFRKTLPIINAKLSQLLSDVCDFDVEVGINVKNDVMFYLIKDGIKSDLSSGSGFELTAASLALRSVLAELSTIPRNSFVLMDEITGRVAQENFENIHNLINKMLKNYDFIFMISHLDAVKSWATSNVVVEKSDNISKITLVKNNI
jgi:DNA repair exonuclease SbcCD ATPase subunit